MTRRKINNKLRCHTRWRFVGPTGAQKKKKLRGKKPQHDRPPLRTEKLSTADTRSQHERVFLIYIWSEQIAYVYRSTSTRLHAIVYLVIYSFILSLSLSASFLFDSGEREICGQKPQHNSAALWQPLNSVLHGILL